MISSIISQTRCDDAMTHTNTPQIFNNTKTNPTTTLIAVHAQGAEFDKIKQLIESHKLAYILDLGCGGGHVSYQGGTCCHIRLLMILPPTMTEVVASRQNTRLNQYYHANRYSRKLPLPTTNLMPLSRAILRTIGKMYHKHCLRCIAP